MYERVGKFGFGKEKTFETRRGSRDNMWKAGARKRRKKNEILGWWAEKGQEGRVGAQRDYSEWRLLILRQEKFVGGCNMHKERYKLKIY